MYEFGLQLALSDLSSLMSPTMLMSLTTDLTIVVFCSKFGN